MVYSQIKNQLVVIELRRAHRVHYETFYGTMIRRISCVRRHSFHPQTCGSDSDRTKKIMRRMTKKRDEDSESL
jgi:hypothetical protein